jgi:hypothetical protein
MLDRREGIFYGAKLGIELRFRNSIFPVVYPHSSRGRHVAVDATIGALQTRKSVTQTRIIQRCGTELAREVADHLRKGLVATRPANKTM